MLQWLAFLVRNQESRVRILAWKPLILNKISSHLPNSFNERGKKIISIGVRLLLHSRCFFLAHFPSFEKINAYAITMLSVYPTYKVFNALNNVYETCYV
jgi:hypothetical protein